MKFLTRTKPLLLLMIAVLIIFTITKTATALTTVPLTLVDDTNGPTVCPMYAPPPIGCSYEVNPNSTNFTCLLMTLKCPEPEDDQLTDSSCTLPSMTLKYGDGKGNGKTNDVILLQKTLIENGYLTITRPTGFYGSMTSAAVRKYQAAKGIPRTGNYDQATRAKMIAGCGGTIKPVCPLYPTPNPPLGCTYVAGPSVNGCPTQKLSCDQTPLVCYQGKVNVNGVCVCPAGYTIGNNGTCNTTLPPSECHAGQSSSIAATCTCPAGQKNVNGTCVVTVQPPSSFSLDLKINNSDGPVSISGTQSVNASWTSTGSNLCRLYVSGVTGNGVLTKGSQALQIDPSISDYVQLTCRNSSTQVETSDYVYIVTSVVTGQTPTASLTISPQGTAVYPKSISYTLSSQNAKSCKIEDQNGLAYLALNENATQKTITRTTLPGTHNLSAQCWSGPNGTGVASALFTQSITISCPASTNWNGSMCAPVVASSCRVSVSSSNFQTNAGLVMLVSSTNLEAVQLSRSNSNTWKSFFNMNGSNIYLAGTFAPGSYLYEFRGLKTDGSTIACSPSSISLTVTAPPVSTVLPISTQKDLTFNANGKVYTFDLYRPVDWGSMEKLPALLWVHGGSWTAGDKDQESLTASKIAETGVSVFVPNYSSEVRPYTGHEDISEMTSLLFDYAAGLNLDTKKISVGGVSAGGHLALLGGINSRETLKCLLSVSGPRDLPYVMSESDSYPVSAFIISDVFGSGATTLGNLSPINKVNSINGSAKVLLAHQRNDNLVPLTQATRFSAALKSRGINVTESYYSASLGGLPAIRPTASQVSHLWTGTEYPDLVRSYFKTNCSI